jgi:hypothetical protein
MDALPEVKKARARQIRPPVEAAIQLIVSRAVTIAEAAQSVGMQGPSLAKALRRPHVSDRLASVRREWMESQTFKAWVGVAELADGAASEDTRLKALRTILEAAGELGPNRRDDGSRPATLVQIITHARPERHQVTIQRGGVIEAAPYDPSSRDDEA